MRSMEAAILELIKEKNVRNPGAVEQTLIRRRFSHEEMKDYFKHGEIINYELKIHASIVRMVRRGKLRYNSNTFRLVLPRKGRKK